MKHFSFHLLMGACMVAMSAVSCSDNNTNATTDKSANDTDRVDTRRNNTDTTNYLTKDSGNKSQDVVDPNPPQNSKY